METIFLNCLEIHHPIATSSSLQSFTKRIRWCQRMQYDSFLFSIIILCITSSFLVVFDGVECPQHNSASFDQSYNVLKSKERTSVIANHRQFTPRKLPLLYLFLPKNVLGFSFWILSIWSDKRVLSLSLSSPGTCYQFPYEIKLQCFFLNTMQSYS